MPACDAMVTDVSSVGLDWLFLRTEGPLFITDRHDDPEPLRRAAPVSRCADVVHSRNVDGLADLLTARLAHDELHLARIAMRRHYFDDVEVGDSTARFTRGRRRAGRAPRRAGGAAGVALATEVAQHPLAGQPTR